ncbi:MAG: MFS transporter [Ginsengibacter sp.]
MTALFGPPRLPLDKRIEVAGFCFAVLVISYCDRVNLATAAPAIMNQYHWGTVPMGWILSAFFLGYTCCLIPAGFLVQRYGARLVLVVGVASWSLVTVLTPLPTSIAGLYCMRLLLGVCESGTFPAINALLVEWFPPSEYARAAGICWSGGYAGPILAFPLAGIILQALGWKAVFYAFGAMGAALLMTGVYIDGRVRSGQGPGPGKYFRQPAAKIAWKRLLASPAVWGLLILHFSSNWFAYVLLSWLPVYLQQERHFSVTSTAFGAAIPFLAAFGGTSIFAVLIDKFSRHHSRTAARKIFLVFYLLGGIALLALPLARDAISIVGTLSISSFLMTAATPIYASGSLDLVPGLAAVLVGIQASFANLAGVLAPVVSGYLMKMYSWNAVFALTAGIGFVGAAAYLLFGRAEVLPFFESMTGSEIGGYR